MKKIKTLMPVLAIASVGAVVTPVMALTSCNKNNPVKNMNYSELKEWIKTTWGATARTFEAPTKAESTWNMNGKVTRNGEQATDTYVGYHKNHTISFLSKYSFASTDDEKAAITNSYSWDATEKTYKFERTNKLSVTTIDATAAETSLYAPLSTNNLDDLLYTYFGLAGRTDITFTVNTETKILKMTGLLSAYLTEAGGTNYWRIPYCTLTFDSKGRLTNFDFAMGDDADCEYLWYNTGSKLDHFEFTMQKNDSIHFAYSYTSAN